MYNAIFPRIKARWSAFLTLLQMILCQNCLNQVLTMFQLITTLLQPWTNHTPTLHQTPVVKGCNYCIVDSIHCNLLQSALIQTFYVCFIFPDKPIPEDVNPLSSAQVTELHSHSISWPISFPENTRTEPYRCYLPSFISYMY